MLLKKAIKVKDTEFHNRLVFAPMGMYLAKNGVVTEKVLEHYETRTTNARFSLVVIEHTYIHADGRIQDEQLGLDSDDKIDGFKKLYETIAKNGSKAVVQLNHNGGATKRQIIGKQPISAGTLRNKNLVKLDKQMGEEMPKMMNKDEIKMIVECYANAALRAEKAGLDGVCLHGAHGYLLNQFYSPLTNNREDEYGAQTIENRTRLHQEVIKAVKELVSSKFIVTMRFGGCDYEEGGSTIDDSVKAAILLEKAGVDIIDLSGGMCFYTHPQNKKPGYFSDMSVPIKNKVKIPVVLTGGVKEIEQAEKLLEEQKADFIGVGRKIISDKHFAENICDL